MDKKVDAINKILLSLLGSDQLVKAWWKSPNYAFDLKTPEILWQEGDQRKVVDYILAAYGR